MQFPQLFWIAAACSPACGEANRSVTPLQKLFLLETKSLGDKHFYGKISRIFGYTLVQKALRMKKDVKSY
jgi:hypothetical protein